ncbi:hypothetical protein HCN44_002285 [Aphidius gifuensis]|uniref:PNPLA domain-containing protein n=1 Tax=Aphidius gifuensis TaxID=684658 RepID=A0A834Y3T8_APHGI|nr:calcium-independent phospholipase A2-gamma-like isoform X2 [Aphidius gifuensis]KAF7996639.1 hypothetical protein HCN44_002285 [Aphidius gifuensis]
MVLSKHARHYRRGISLTRRVADTLTTSPTNGTDNLRKILTKSKSTMQNMQNQSKLFGQFKAHLGKFEYNKQLQLVVNKYWTNIVQKITYPGLESIRTFSGDDSINNKKIQIDQDDKIELDKNVQNSSKIDQENKTTIAIQSSSSNKNVLNDATTTITTSAPNSTLSNQMYQNTRDSIMALPQVFNDLIIKLTDNGNKESSSTTNTVPKWKTNIINQINDENNINKNISENSIVSRTKHVLNSIVTAESLSSKAKRIEDFLSHIDQYPEARHHAIKEGAIRIFLKARQKTNNKEIQAGIREGLAVLGYIEPVSRRGIRILSIDGGGMRGLLVLEMLKKLEELTGQKVHEMFDYMCGVSTGAILSATFGGHKKKSLNEISEVYKELSTKIFTQGALKGTSNLVWSHAYYDTALLEELLQEHLGDKDLIKTLRDPNSPKFSAIASIFDHVHTMAYIFRNYTLPASVESQYMGSHRHKLWEAVRASAAAPTYFEEFKHGNFVLSDGGIMVNNPCAVAIHEAKLLWPNTPIQCVVSFGTGRIPPNIYDPNRPSSNETLSSTSWKDKFSKILASATDTEGVHIMLNDLLPDHVYYRFNPYISEMITMEEKRAEKLAQLEQDARMYIRKNEDKFIQAAIALNQNKRLSQKILDWIEEKRHLHGFN